MQIDGNAVDYQAENQENKPRPLVPVLPRQRIPQRVPDRTERVHIGHIVFRKAAGTPRHNQQPGGAGGSLDLVFSEGNGLARRLILPPDPATCK